MDLTPAALQVFFTGLSTIYQQGYDTTEPWSDKIAMTVPSDTELETYGWMDLIPKMREWIGPRTINNAPLRSRSLANKDWEETQSIPRNKFLDDKLGLYSPMAMQMGQNARKLHDEQLALLLQSNPTGFDGKSFFATNHNVNIDDPGDPANQSNLLNLSLTPDNFATAIQTMPGWLGRNGRPLGSRASLLVVPPALMIPAMVILKSTIIAPGTFAGSAGQVGSTTNVLAGATDLLVIDELNNDPTAWYLFDNRSAVKALMKQVRQEANFSYLINPTDANVFFRKEYIFGADSRSAYDVTLWFKALKSKP